jgi:hypothetical protein
LFGVSRLLLAMTDLQKTNIGYNVRLTRISTRVYCCLAILFQNPG